MENWQPYGLEIPKTCCYLIYVYDMATRWNQDDVPSRCDLWRASRASPGSPGTAARPENEAVLLDAMRSASHSARSPGEDDSAAFCVSAAVFARLSAADCTASAPYDNERLNWRSRLNFLRAVRQLALAFRQQPWPFICKSTFCNEKCIYKAGLSCLCPQSRSVNCYL